MDIDERVVSFGALHRPCEPLILVNAWDVGSARAVVDAGAYAIATSSWAVAAAAGYPDGEELPLERLVDAANAIVRAVDVPVTIDFEAGYADTPEEVRANARGLLAQGVVGCNFEDRVVKGTGLRSISDQCARINAVVDAAKSLNRRVFVNARTDLFLSSAQIDHRDFVDEALVRARAYANAGAAGFFVPGLTDPDLIGEICRESPLPVNVMVLDLNVDLIPLAALGVARISFGPAPYQAFTTTLIALARRLLA